MLGPKGGVEAKSDNDPVMWLLPLEVQETAAFLPHSLSGALQRLRSGKQDAAEYTSSEGEQGLWKGPAAVDFFPCTAKIKAISLPCAKA